MLSDTIMASSTMIPRTMIMDVNVIVSKNESKKGNRNIAPMKVNGIPIATQIDRVKFMNKRRIKITSANPMIPFQSTMLKLFLTVVDSSLANNISTFSGKVLLISEIFSLILLHTLILSASSDFLIYSAIVGLPFKCGVIWFFSKPSLI